MVEFLEELIFNTKHHFKDSPRVEFYEDMMGALLEFDPQFEDAFAEVEEIDSDWEQAFENMYPEANETED